MRRHAMTESPTPNPAMLKLGAVALAAYLLGRMKKGRAAIGLAMWAAGARMDPKQLLREGLLSVANSAEGREVLAQLRGPVLEAGRKAAGATLEGQVAALTSALEKRTAALSGGLQKVTDAAGQAAGTAGQAAGTAGQAAETATGEAGQRAAALTGGIGKVTGLIGRGKRKKGEDEAEAAPAETDEGTQDEES